MPDATTLLYVFRREAPADAARPYALAQDVRATLRSWTAPAGRSAVILAETPEQVVATLCFAPDEQAAALQEFSQRCALIHVACAKQEEALVRQAA